MTAHDISDVTPESHRACIELFSKMQNRGRYTPYGAQPTVVFPGTLGGAAWSGLSFDPQLGYAYVNTNEAGAIGQIASAGGHVFIAATNDSRFRASDARTGQELWSTPIDASGHATPSTYQGRDGKQYAVIAAGGGGFFGSKSSGSLIAFRLGS